MFRPSKKFVAVLLAIWLPLFSGNALAVAIAMQSSKGECHAKVAQQNKHHSQQATITQQHIQHTQQVVNLNQSAGTYDPQNSPGSTCHLACCVYLATFAIKVAEAQLLAQSFTSPSTQFQSYTSAPLDPPPLSRV